MKPTLPEHDDNIRFVQQLFEREYRNLYRLLLLRLNNDEDTHTTVYFKYTRSH